MPVDTFICGNCGNNFHDIQTFLQHKNECAGPETTTMVVAEEDVTQTHPSAAIGIMVPHDADVGDMSGSTQTIHVTLAPPAQPVQVTMTTEDGVHIEGMQAIPTSGTDGTQGKLNIMHMILLVFN